MTETAELPTRKMSLLDMLSTFEELCELAETAETEEERKVVQTEIDHMFLTDLPRKVDGIAMYDRRSKAKEAAVKDDAAVFRATIRQIKRQRELFRAWISLAVEKTPDKYVRGLNYNLSIRPGREAVKITDELAIPSHYMRVIVEPNGDAILKALKAGIKVPGCELARGAPVLTISSNARVTADDKEDEQTIDAL